MNIGERKLLEKWKNKCKICERKFYQRGKIGKHSLDHITEIKNLKKLQTVRLSHEVENLTTIVNHKHLTTHAADHHPGEHEKEVVTYEDKEKLNWKENQTNNHGAAKRLHKFKMAANHVTEMAAYTPDNDRCYNWREKHKRELLIIIDDVKMDRCLLLEIDKNKKIVKHWTMEWENKIYIQTNLQIT